MMDTKPVKSPEVVELDPVLTIRHAAALKEMLLAALDRTDAVELAIDENAEADLSFVQLIESARLQASLRSKSLRLASPAGGQVLKTLRRAGLTTDMSSQSRAFWLHEKESL